MQKVVIVGASLAGLRAAGALRKHGFDGRVVIIGDEAHVPYDRPPLSKQVLVGQWPASKVYFNAREDHAALGVDWVLGRRAQNLAVAERAVVLDDGQRVDYEGLVIATGATPRALANPAALRGVYTLRTLDDALAIHGELAKQPRVAVVGAGFIGLEVAASCRKHGLAVTLIEPQRMPLLGLLGPVLAEAIQRLHFEQGVQLRLGVMVDRLEGRGRVERLVLSDGSQVEADLVVVGIGVIPETRWLEGSGLDLGDGVLCDARCATNVPGIVAAGDVARWHNVWSGESMRVEHWSNAVEQGQAAAVSLLLGAAAPEYAHVPYFWSDQYHVKLQCAGRPRADDSVVIREGDIATDTYVALYGRRGQLAAVLASNRPARFLRYRKLVAQRVSFDDACAGKASGA